jgi:flagellin
MLSIQTNVNSLVAQQNLSVNSNFQSKTIQQLTSGYRINHSGDDAAGLAVANKYRSSIAELTQGVANGNDGVAQLQIMDGGINNIAQMLDRLKTLAMQSASGSFTGNRTTLNNEFQTDLGEIDRQAQSIGLNTGGLFAKSLQVYLGAGSGSQATANSAVSVDLSKSTVDSQSLGLTGVQAINSATYDLAASSTTNVANIVGDATNLNGGSAQATFNFVGAGFSNNAGVTANSGQNVTVNLTGISSADSLIAAINNAIQAQANGPTANDAALKAANITASIVTDANGNQKLAFNSSSSSFQVQGTDRMSNALLGNFAADGSSAATGAQMGTTITAASLFAAAGAAGLNMSVNNVTLTITGGGVGGTKTVTLNTDYSVLANFATQGAVAADITSLIHTAMGTTNVTASIVASKLQFATNDGSTISVSASGNAAQVGALGMSAVANTSSGTSATSGAAYGTYAAGGGYELGTSSGAQNDLAFVALGASGSQAITVSANDASGKAQPLTIQLTTNGGSTGSGQDIQHAAAYINQQLQASGNSTLQQITAVINTDNGVSKLNFVSTLNNFTVSLGSGTGGNGFTETNPANASQQIQNVSLLASKVGAGGSADISTMSGAQVAVAAITASVTALGTAQAAVGKGQNVLNYAINLAQSQITNFSSAEAQIRDADVAAEAANLSKAQVLQQASIAAMAQANSAPQAILALLRG